MMITIFNIKLFSVKNFSEKYDWKKSEKIIKQLLLMCYLLKNENIFCLYLKIQFKSWKTNHSFNDSKWRRMALPRSKKLFAWKMNHFFYDSKQRRMELFWCKKLSALWKHNGSFYCLNCLHSFRAKNKLQSHEKYEKIKIFVVF